jgi:hypothetical protein
MVIAAGSRSHSFHLMWEGLPSRDQIKMKNTLAL